MVSMTNCTITGVRLEEYHNSVRKRPVWTVRTDDGREHHIDDRHVTDGARVGARATMSYEETDWGCAYIVRPEHTSETAGRCVE